MDILTQLNEQAEKLREVIKELDVECRYCKHSTRPLPCEHTNIICDDCAFDCACKNCRNNSNYELNI